MPSWLSVTLSAAAAAAHGLRVKLDAVARPGGGTIVFKSISIGTETPGETATMAIDAAGAREALIAPKDGLSYVRGTTEVPLSAATIGAFLLETAQRFPERPAVVFREQGIRWNWREFANE